MKNSQFSILNFKLILYLCSHYAEVIGIIQGFIKENSANILFAHLLLALDIFQLFLLYYLHTTFFFLRS